MLVRDSHCYKHKSDSDIFGIWLFLVLNLHDSSFFFTFRHREDYGDGHVLFVRRDRKEKAGSFPWIYVGRA